MGLDARVLFYFNAGGVTPAMALTIPGAGSDYAIGFLDANGQPFDGSKTYRLHLPPNVPVSDFWAVTLYDTQTRSMLQTSQRFPTVGSQTEGMKKNADGSYDIYFAPKAPKGQEGNWVQTLPSQELVHAPAHVRTTGALDQQDLATERDYAGQINRRWAASGRDDAVPWSNSGQDLTSGRSWLYQAVGRDRPLLACSGCTRASAVRRVNANGRFQASRSEGSGTRSRPEAELRVDVSPPESRLST